MKRFLLLFYIFLFLTVPQAFSQNQYKNSAETSCTLSINSNVYGANVYIDGSYIGMTPLSVELPQARHSITVSKSHYKTKYLSLYLNTQNSSIYVELEKITGFISYSVSPQNATVYCDGTSMHSNPYEADEGSHTIRAEAFGYNSNTQTVYVKKNQTTNISISLSNAPFNITKLETSSKSFNPTSHGKLALIAINFSVTAPEEGTFTIENEFGDVLYQKTIYFSTWNYSEKWNGRDANDNSLCPDGEYTAKLIAGGMQKECKFSIDTSLQYPQLAITTGGTGLGAVPSALTYPKGTFLLGFKSGIEFHGPKASFYDVPINGQLSWSFTNNSELSLLVNGLIRGDEESSILTTITYKYGNKKQINTSLDFLYGFNVRVGVYNGIPSYEPYGVDCGTGLGASLLLGLLYDDINMGFSSTILYMPFHDFSGENSDKYGDENNFIWKNALMLQKVFNNGMAGVYAAVHTTGGTFEGSDIAGGIRAIETGVQGALYIGSSATSILLDAGAICLKQDIYPYTHITVQFMF